MKYIVNHKEKRHSKTHLTKGAFGKVQDLQLYLTLKVIPRSKRDTINVNKCGVLNG